jgi:integrase
MPASLRLAVPRNFFSDSTTAAAGHRRAARPRVPNARGGREAYGCRQERRPLRHRDTTLILIAYRHGLRASEIADLEWPQVELGRNATLHVRRASGAPFKDFWR